MYGWSRQLAIKYGLKVALDISYYFQDQCRNLVGPNQELFWLAHYRIKYDKLIRSDVFSIRKKLADLFEFYDDTDSVVKNTVFLESRSLDYHYLRGFWQNERYFADVRSVILKELTLVDAYNPPCLDLIRNAECSVGMSVRRGDFIRCNDRPVLSPAYYANCASMMIERFPNATFFVFSDDDGWVADHVLTEPVFRGRAVQIPRTVCYKDLSVLSNCQHHIIPNSTFSWWGAWLCRNEKKVVIGPKFWNNGSLNIMPSEWLATDVV